MNKRLIIPALFGAIGTGLLLWLGFWQLQRLEWKQAYLDDINARIHAAPVALPERPDRSGDKFLAVNVSGQVEGPEIHVLASRKQIGAGYKVITAFVTEDGRRILLDRGFIPISAKNDPRAPKPLTVTGNLHWPDETDKYTPLPDTAANIWFARDVDALARALDTEPVLIMASSDTGDGIEAFPVSTGGIPNDHLNYAITWFLMAAAWLGMTVFLLWRIKRRNN